MCNIIGWEGTRETGDCVGIRVNKELKMHFFRVH